MKTKNSNCRNGITETRKGAAKARRPSRAARILSDPQIVRYLATTKALALADDVAALTRLFCLMQGRQLRQDPRQVARRYLCRARGGIWYSGGSHVARLHFGPGIAWREAHGQPLSCQLINATLQLPSSAR